MEFEGGNFWQVFQTSGPIGIGVFLILLGMSVLSWAIIFMKYVQISKASLDTEKFLDFFFKSTNLKQILEVSREYPTSPVSQMFEAGFKDVLALKDELKDMDSILSIIDRNLRRIYTIKANHLEGWVSFLATVAST
ncbi:MAG: hypothetical protein NZT61_07850, partial [Deltaproteobacteria bacterium]|nr:hypothetical protein [Deltaproteobacteria bacterium]